MGERAKPPWLRDVIEGGKNGREVGKAAANENVPIVPGRNLGGFWSGRKEGPLKFTKLDEVVEYGRYILGDHIELLEKEVFPTTAELLFAERCKQEELATVLGNHFHHLLSYIGDGKKEWEIEAYLSDKDIVRLFWQKARARLLRK